jgi:hypothetical protein
MTGFTDYSGKGIANWMTGQVAMPALPAVYLALFTAVGVDAGTGFTEVTGGAYARVQVAGSAATNGTTAAGNAILHFASVPAWITAGMDISDTTAAGAIPGGTTVLSVTSTTVTMSANATGGGVGNGDTIVFSAFGAASGSQPSQVQNNAAITFPQATASWGTVVAFGLYDAASSGNQLDWDFLGNFAWRPFTSTSVGSGNGAVLTAPAHGYANSDPVVVTAEYGGTLPTVTQGALASYTQNFVANGATDNFTLSSSASAPTSGNAVWTSTTGSGMARKITQQSIPANITASFGAATLTLTVA